MICAEMEASLVIFNHPNSTKWKCLPFRVGDLTEDNCWQWRGAKSTSLSVYHLHCYVMTLQTSGVHFMF